MITVRPLTGPALDAALDDLARLRIQVFRAWPYLYDGDLDYERSYLETYRNSPGAILVGAFDQTQLIGAATGTPMADHAQDFAAPLSAHGYDLDQIFYCAESVLDPGYRGRGIGHAFFNHREAHAQELGARYSCFCGVVRPKDHPMRDADVRPLDGFWRKRGYQPLEGAIAHFPWRDIGAAEETQKPLQIWMKPL